MIRPRTVASVRSSTPAGTSLDAAGMVVRVRRLADLSQRDLAALLGVSPATVARWESGARRIELAALEAVLRVAGFRLEVVDDQGRAVAPVPADAVRDNSGRRFPAHLDVQPPDVLPYEAISSPRYDRDAPKGWYHRRQERDLQRAAGLAPAEHPTATELAQRRRRRLLAGRPAPSQGPLTREECQCPASCWVGRECLSSCGCQCEPASAGSPAESRRSS